VARDCPLHPRLARPLLPAERDTTKPDTEVE